MHQKLFFVSSYMYPRIEKLAENKQFLLVFCCLCIVCAVNPYYLAKSLGGVQKNRVVQMVVYSLITMIAYFSGPLAFSLSLLYGRLLAEAELTNTETNILDSEMNTIEKVPNTYVSPYENDHIVRGNLENVVAHDPKDRLAQISN